MDDTNHEYNHDNNNFNEIKRTNTISNDNKYQIHQK